MPLTEYQQAFLRNCSHRWNIKTGATRSGKTYLDCAVTIPQRILAAHCNGDMHAALDYAAAVKHQQRDFVAKRGIRAIIN